MHHSSNCKHIGVDRTHLRIGDTPKDRIVQVKSHCNVYLEATYLILWALYLRAFEKNLQNYQLAIWDEKRCIIFIENGLHAWFFDSSKINLNDNYSSPYDAKEINNKIIIVENKILILFIFNVRIIRIIMVQGENHQYIISIDLHIYYNTYTIIYVFNM